jgi:hypothetical protein
MVHHATLLYIHLRELDRLNGKFEAVAPVMEKLSIKEGKVPKDTFLTVQRFLASRSGCGVLLGRLMSVPVTSKCET